MWFIKSWIYKSRYGNLPFKMRNFTESYQEDCRESIKEKFQGITAKLEYQWIRIKLKDAKEIMHGKFVDILDRAQPVKHPLFTQNEVERFSQYRRVYAGVFVLLVLFESILYSLLARLFIPTDIRKELPETQLIFGFAIALIFVGALHFAFKSIFEFFEAKYLVEKDNLPKVELKPFYKNLFLGMFVLVLFIVTNIYVGYIRAMILEPSSTSSTSFIDKIHGPLLIVSIALTFVVAVVMALLENEIAKKNEKFKVYKNWEKQQKERKAYNNDIKNMLKNCVESKEILIEEYWGVLKDLQRVFEMECDEDRKPMYDELNQKVANDEIDLQQLSDKVYQKYLPVAATRLELFRFGIDSDKDIAARITDLKNKVAKIEEFEAKNAIKENGSKPETEVVLAEEAVAENQLN